MKQSEDLISIIVPVYNVEKYLRKCIDSIVNQTYKNLEIILVDDGSTDDSGKICDEFAEKDGRIKVIHKENGGLSSARNAGLEIAAGKYLGFVDSDDYIAQDMYESMYAAINEFDADIACCGRYDVYDDKPMKKSFVMDRPIEMKSIDAIGRVLMWDGMDSSACDKLYKSYIFEEIRYPIGKINEDIAIAFNILEKAGKIIHIGLPKYYYAHRENSITTMNLSKKTMDLFKISCTINEELSLKYPQINKKIKYFFLHNILYLYLRILDTNLEKEFYGEYCELRRILYRSTWTYLSNKFTLREKIKFICVIYFPDLYSFIRRKKRRSSLWNN